MLRDGARSLLLFLLLFSVSPLSLFLWARGGVEVEPVRVAAAANLRSVLPLLIDAYARSAESGSVEAVYASSGKLYAQILARAPFDLYLSANDDYPRRLSQAGYGIGSPQVYARGRLVCVSKDPGFPADSSLDRLLVWLATSEGTVAIANPELAPYGTAYKRFYQSFADRLPRGLDPSLSSGSARILLAGNVGQAKQFLVAGAQAAFLPFSDLSQLGEEYRRHEIDGRYAGAIRQAGLLIDRGRTDSPEEARALWAFLLSDTGQGIFRDAGYR